MGENAVPSNASSKFSMVTYDPVGHGLDKVDWPVAGMQRLPEGPLVVVREQKTAYYISGSPLLSLPTQVFAYNYSDSSVTVKPAPDRVWSSAVFVPVGAKGVVVVLAGKQMNQGQWVPVNMNDVHVYDIATAVWFLQKTSGDIPLRREEICAVVVSAPDGSSHQVGVLFRARSLCRTPPPFRSDSPRSTYTAAVSPATSTGSPCWRTTTSSACPGSSTRRCRRAQSRGSARPASDWAATRWSSSAGATRPSMPGARVCLR